MRTSISSQMQLCKRARGPWPVLWWPPERFAQLSLRPRQPVGRAFDRIRAQIQANDGKLLRWPFNPRQRISVQTDRLELVGAATIKADVFEQILEKPLARFWGNNMRWMPISHDSFLLYFQYIQSEAAWHI
ncbi:hypothetical protein AB4Z48_32430 [Cupriavidus sp. 2TAF22]|uniref:hypothetical protein n=1 Tax=unclassified Cupriavidus TaxID=2640874 RepID=UPI003F91AC0F